MKIRTKINISFLTIFILVSSLVGLVVGIHTTNLVKENIFSYLRSSNKARAENIRTFLQDHISIAKIMAASAVYRDLLKESIDSPQYSALKIKVENRLKRTVESDDNFIKLFILDKKGKIVASSDLSEEGKDKSAELFFLNGKNDVFIKDIHFAEDSNETIFLISTPIKDDISDEVLGVSVAKYKTDKFYSIIGNENGLGNTEENFLVNKEKFFITPSKFLGETVILKQKVETQNVNDCFDPEEIQYVEKNDYSGLGSSENNAQIVESVDYRNIDVIATHSYIPETAWCLITKADKSDLMSFRNTLILIFLSIFASGGLIYLLIGFLISKKITNPIKDLVLETELLTKQFSTTTTTTTTTTKSSKDEINILKWAFNIMTTELKKSYNTMKDKIRDRTEELEVKAKDLEKQKSAILNILEDVQVEKTKALSLASIINSAEEPIVGKDLDGKIVSWNHGAENLYGYMEEEVVGQSIKLIVPLDKQEELDNIFKTIKEGKSLEHFQTIRKKKDGSLVDVSISVSPIKDSDGKTVGVSTITMDISKEKQIDKAKTEFVSLASHQLRTPLSAINWYTEMLLDGDAGPINDEQKKYLEEVAIGNKRMIDLIDSLLNVSRLDLGTFIIEPKPTNIAEMAGSVVRELQPLIKERKLKVEEIYDEKIPEFQADQKLLRMIIQNLLSNSVKYTPAEGSVKIELQNKSSGEVWGGKKLEENYIGIKVSDSGMGIPDNQKDKIFSKMFRADNVRETETEGTGLGLYIIKSIVDQSGGDIWFESEQNKGTAFYVIFSQSGMKKKEGTKKLD